MCLDAINERKQYSKEELLGALYTPVERTSNDKILACTRNGDVDIVSSLEGCLAISIVPDFLTSDIRAHISSRLQKGRPRSRRMNVEETVGELTAETDAM